MELEVGLKGAAATLAERSDTALEVGSGDLLVYATPCMAALMEGAACEAIAGCLKEGQTTVGTALNIAHTSATPVGMEVRAEAEVTAVEGKVISRLSCLGIKFINALSERLRFCPKINPFCGSFCFCCRFLKYIYPQG